MLGQQRERALGQAAPRGTKATRLDVDRAHRGGRAREQRGLGVGLERRPFLVAVRVHGHLVTGARDRLQRLWVHLRVQALHEERRPQAVARELLEQARKDFRDREVLAHRHLRRPHPQLELRGLAEVVERDRHDRVGHAAMIRPIASKLTAEMASLSARHITA